MKTSWLIRENDEQPGGWAQSSRATPVREWPWVVWKPSRVLGKIFWRVDHGRDPEKDFFGGHSQLAAKGGGGFRIKKLANSEGMI
jgi:hypothetical protein